MDRQLVHARLRRLPLARRAGDLVGRKRVFLVGGALGLAVLATLSVEATQDTLVGLGREPQPGDEARALVDGFHVAYLGSALLIAVGFIALLFLLSRRDVVAVGEGEAAAVGAAAA